MKYVEKGVINQTNVKDLNILIIKEMEKYVNLNLLI